MSRPDVVVLRQSVHGVSVYDYAVELKSRILDSFKGGVARTPAQERWFLESATVAMGLDVSAEAVRATDELALFACTFVGVDNLPLKVMKG